MAHDTNYLPHLASSPTAVLRFKNQGGGVLNRGTLTVDRCTITGNSATYGGGLDNIAQATLVMINSTITGNSATYAGGIYINQNATLQQCTISSNVSAYYAGGSVGGTAVLKNCTIARNASSTQYGWLVSGGNMSLINCTFASNSAASQGGIVLFNATLLMTNTILAGNTPTDWADTGGGTLAGVSNLIGGDVKLGPLSNNGGPTLTMALWSNSPAINAGLTLADIPTDQRGKVRPQFGVPDIGAYELTAFDTGQTVVTAPDGADWYLGAPALGNDLSIYREALGQIPVTVGGAAVRIGGANDGTVLVENASGGVYARSGSTTGLGIGWQQLTAVTAGDGATWFLGADGPGNDFYTYRWSAGDRPTYVSGWATQISVLTTGAIAVRNSGGTSYFRVGSGAGIGSAWQLIASTPPTLTGPTRLGNGSFIFNFTNVPGASFTVLTSTNMALPLGNWTSLGTPNESPAGTYQFTDSAATNSPARFYRVSSP